MIQKLNSAARRHHIIMLMEQLSDSAINCFQCLGTCCTFEANSMKITPLEAIELYLFLKSKDRLGFELNKMLNEVITYYRLDVEIQTHRYQYMRKTYTCPFYTTGSKGCSISPEYKPYGCLAFNPAIANCNGDGGCLSNVELLSKREDSWCDNEDKVNFFIKNILNLSWDKLDIPRGLLGVIQKSELMNNEFLVNVNQLLEQ